jgi:competence protein ComEC
MKVACSSRRGFRTGLDGPWRSVVGRPLACAVGCFALGLATAARAGSSAAISPNAALIAACALAAAALFLRRLAAPKTGLRPVYLGLAAAFCFGVFWYGAPRIGADDVSRLTAIGGVRLRGTVISPPVGSDRTQRFIVEADERLVGDPPRRAQGRVFVTAPLGFSIARGRRVEIVGVLCSPREGTNPGELSERAYLARRGVGATMMVGDVRLIRILGPGRLGPVTRFSDAVHEKILALLERSSVRPYRETSARLMASLLFGLQAAAPPPEIVQSFRAAGTLHILVVSGTQVSLLFALVFLPGSYLGRWRRRTDAGTRRWRPGRMALLGALLATIAYAVVSEGGESVVRAAIMAGLVAVALLLRRTPRIADEHVLQVDKYTLLAAAALALLVWRPVLLFDPGLQLSFAAVFGLTALAGPLSRQLSFLPRPVAFGVGGVTAAQLATAPILLSHFHTFPLVGFAANLVVVPLAAVLLVTGLAAATGAALSPALSLPLGWLNGWLVWLMVRLSAAFAALPGAGGRWLVAPPSAVQCVLCYGLLAALAVWLARRPSRQDSPGLSPMPA